jgi:uncharacterized peroxidase-related enzyme
MAIITLPNIESVPKESRALLDAVAKELGFIPNVFRLMSISSNVLKGFIGLQKPLSQTLDFRIRDAIALAVSEVNGCHYCLAAHSHAAKHVDKIDIGEIERNRHGTSSDVKVGAAAKFAATLIETRGHLSGADFEAVRKAGFSDAEILEMVALSAQYLLTNLVNSIAGTEIDFPMIEPA